MAFSFHANTLAFGGQFEEASSRRKLLPSQASVALPQEGGFGESSVSNYSEDGISFDRAESRVYGNSFKNRLFKTYANVTVYGLDIAGILQADVLSATIISINRRQDDCTSESRISFDASIVGLVIDGVPYDVDIDTTPFLKHGTLGEFTDSFTKMTEEEVRANAAAYNWPFDQCTTKTSQGVVTFHVPVRCSNGLRATVVRDIKPSLPGYAMKLPRTGFTLEVPNLGLVHLGEVLLTTGRRTINMLRVDPFTSLEDVSTEPVSMETDAVRPRALALAELDTQPLAASGPSTYTVTIGNATGNGTDFGPP